MTLAYTNEFWHCHRCGKGGDVFTLVQEVEGIGFRDALNFTARLAGVATAKFDSDAFGERRKHRERAERAATTLGAAERRLRLQCRDALHQLDKTQRRTSELLAKMLGKQNPGAESAEETLWGKLQEAVNRRERICAAYYLLAFGRLSDRARFVMRPKDRDLLIAEVLGRGVVRADDGKPMEVAL